MVAGTVKLEGQALGHGSEQERVREGVVSS
jgi:hypothetical protein